MTKVLMLKPMSTFKLGTRLATLWMAARLSCMACSKLSVSSDLPLPLLVSTGLVSAELDCDFGAESGSKLSLMVGFHVERLGLRCASSKICTSNIRMCTEPKVRCESRDSINGLT